VVCILCADGFVLDDQMRKMSKSLGNVLDPSTLINGQPSASVEDAPVVESSGGKKKPIKVAPPGAPLGVDLLRLWVASSDFASDVSIGKTVLGKTSEGMKKLRESARFILGNIQDLSPNDVVPHASLSQLDRYTLSLLSSFASSVTHSFERWEFREVVQQILAFNSSQLSAFAFDLSKDRLYAEAPNSPLRRAAQTVLLHALVVLTKSLAPLVPHFSEEIYQHVPASLRSYFHADDGIQQSSTPVDAADSVFMHGWMGRALGDEWANDALTARVDAARRVRSHATKLLERVRQERKAISSFAGAQMHITVASDSQLYRDLSALGPELTTLLSINQCTLLDSPVLLDETGGDDANCMRVNETSSDSVPAALLLRFSPAVGSKCPRCWLFTPDATTQQPCCRRCQAVLQAHTQTA
jgi:isoleucyl-tRNA synthetase